MVRALFLPGYACTGQIWQAVAGMVSDVCDVQLVEWPAEVAPGFDRLEYFSAWLHRACWPGEYGLLVGHSLGGLVALELMASGRVAIPKAMLVETFLLPVGPFFRNLVLKETESTSMIPAMLEREGKHFSAQLREAVRDVDMREQVRQAGGQLYALYGDRGCASPEHVREELQWPPELAHRVEMSVIPRACHFPMLENPEAVAQALRRVLET